MKERVLLHEAENPGWSVDAETCYLLGLIVGRGTFLEQGATRQLSIQFPDNTSGADGHVPEDETEQAVRASITKVQSRIQKILGVPVNIERPDHRCELTMAFPSDTLAWRFLRNATGRGDTFADFTIPVQLLSDATSMDQKLEFMRGFADVAGNVREANRYVDHRNRVRLDVLNYPGNWTVPVELCYMLQTHLSVPVQLVLWGHPNLGRAWKEHQIDIFVEPFLKIGFGLRYKQKKLSQLAREDHTRHTEYQTCPGAKSVRRAKPASSLENDSVRLCPQLRGHHYDAYWQVCRALGCSVIPPEGVIEESLFDPTHGLEDSEL